MRQKNRVNGQISCALWRDPGVLSRHQMAQIGCFFSPVCAAGVHILPLWLQLFDWVSASPSLPWARDDRCLVTLATLMPQSSRWQSRLAVMPCEVADGPSECAINGKWQARFSMFFLRKGFRARMQGPFLGPGQCRDLLLWRATRLQKGCLRSRAHGTVRRLYLTGIKLQQDLPLARLLSFWN